MKLTDRDIKSILKVMSAARLLEIYINRKITLTSKQVDYLIKLKNEEERLFELKKDTK